MTHFATPALLSKFTDDVLAVLAPSKAHKATGNRDGEQSLSYLVDCLRSKGWKNISVTGWSGNVRDLLEEAGFTLRSHQAGRSVRVYVGV